MAAAGRRAQRAAPASSNGRRCLLTSWHGRRGRRGCSPTPGCWVRRIDEDGGAEDDQDAGAGEHGDQPGPARAWRRRDPGRPLAWSTTSTRCPRRELAIRHECCRTERFRGPRSGPVAAELAGGLLKPAVVAVGVSTRR